MLNQLEQIDADLKFLQTELKKKSGLIRDAMNEPIEALTKYKTSSDKDDPNKFPATELLGTISLLASTKSEKIILRVLNLINNMLKYNYLKEKSLSTVLDFLGTLLEIPEEQIQIKVLQTLLLFINPKHLDLNSFDIIEKILGLSFQLYTSKNDMIHFTIASSMNQITTMIYSHFVEYIKTTKLGEKNETTEKSTSNNNIVLKCTRLLKDLITMTAGNRPEWLPQNFQVPKDCALDLINSILKQVGPLMRLSKEAHQLIKKDLVPLIINRFESKQNDFIAQTVVRILRATSRIVISLHDGLEIIDHVLSMLNHSQSDPERYLGIEALTYTLSDDEILYMMNDRHISTISYFTEFMNHLQKIALEITNSPDLGPKNYVAPSSKLNKIFDSSQDDIEVPVINSGSVYKSICKLKILIHFQGTSLNTISQTFLVLMGKKDIVVGITNNMDTNDKKLIHEWLLQNWKTILKTVKLIFPKDIDEALTQTNLNIIQNFINISGSVGLIQARDSFLMYLCQGSIPNENANLLDLNIRHIQTIKKLFNIAYCFGGKHRITQVKISGILDVDSWHTIFMTLQKGEIIFWKIKNELQPGGLVSKKKITVSQSEQDKSAIKKFVDQEDELSISLDLQVLFSALDTLFAQSGIYSDNDFLSFVNALNKISLGYMEKIVTSEALAAESITVDGKLKIFGLSRMLETILVNLHRIEIVWDVILSHFLCITHSNIFLLRAQGVENLNIIVEKVLEYKKDQFSKGIYTDTTKIEDEKTKKLLEKWNDINWQLTLFQPWVEIGKTKFTDVKENVCAALLKLLQTHGHIIKAKGWEAVADVLFQISQEGGRAILLGFNCLDMIFTDYLHEIDIETVKNLIKVIESFKRISLDNNISYQAIEMFWKIGDHLAIMQTSGKINSDMVPLFKELWYIILKKLLFFSSDDYSEIRQSAIHTLTNLINHHGANFGQQLLNKVMENIILKLLDQLIESYITNVRSDKEEKGTETPKFLNIKATSSGSPDEIPKSEEKVKNPKLWIESMITFCQNILKTLKKYITLVEKIEKLSPQSIEISIVKSCILKFKAILMVAKGDLIYESVHSFHELLVYKPEILAFCCETVFDSLSVLKSFLLEVRQEPKEIKLVINKFIPEIFEILIELYEPEKYNALNPKKLPMGKVIFEILEKVREKFCLTFQCIYYYKQTDSFNTISPQKIITDMKAFYDFLERAPQTLCKENQDITEQYYLFMTKIIGSPITDKFIDMVIRKFIHILQHNICDGYLPESTYLPFLEKILQEFKAVISLRTNIEFLSLTVSSSKTMLPIWLHATDYYLALIQHIMHYFILNKSGIGINEAINRVIPKIMEIYDDVLRGSEKTLGNFFEPNLLKESISKAIFLEIKKDWFEMDMKFVNSITEVILPNFALLNQEQLWNLIHILDYIYSFYTKSPYFIEQGPYAKDSGNSTISKITLEILFKISDISEINGTASNEMKKKQMLSMVATKKLILKCRDILSKYIYDEERSGSMPLPRNRILEVVFLLERLKKLNIPNNCFVLDDTDANTMDNSPINEDGEIIAREEEELDFNNQEMIEKMSLIKVRSKKPSALILLQGSKGHLVYLMPIMAKCITCRDPELKDLLRDTFLEVSKEVGIMFQQ